MPGSFEWFFIPYKNQIKPGYKDHTIEFRVNFLGHLGPFENIKDQLRPNWKIWDHFYSFGPFRTIWDHIWPFWTMLDHCG